MIFRNLCRVVVLIILCCAFHISVEAQSNAKTPEPRTDDNSKLAHEQLCQKIRQGTIDVYFVGDSITRRWGATDYPDFLAHWNRSFHGWNAANFGWGGDRTQNILWRLQNGELDQITPKVFVVLAGTNNVTARSTIEDAEDIASGIFEIVTTCQSKAPHSTVLLMAVFPRRDIPSAKPVIDQINQLLEARADGKNLRFLNLNSQLTDSLGNPKLDLFPDRLHPSLAAYEIWAAALKPALRELLGPPKATDHAPPATGDPKAARR